MTKYKKGKIVKGSITGIEKYGIFVNLDNYYSGLIHISEISTGFVKDIRDYVEVGEMIYAKVLDVNEAENQVKLSIKDIEYRINSMRSNTSKIQEVGSGFAVLEQNRDRWIKEKLIELA